MKFITATRYQLVRIHLVGRVPNQTVLGTVKHPMQRQRKLHDPKVRRQMSPTLRYDRNYRIARLFSYLFNLRQRKLLEVPRCIDTVQNATGHGTHSKTWQPQQQHVGNRAR